MTPIAVPASAELPARTPQTSQHASATTPPMPTCVSRMRAATGRMSSSLLVGTANPAGNKKPLADMLCRTAGVAWPSLLGQKTGLMSSAKAGDYRGEGRALQPSPGDPPGPVDYVLRALKMPEDAI